MITSAHKDSPQLITSIISFYIILRSGVVLVMTLNRAFIYVDLVYCAIVTLYVLRNSITVDKRASIILVLAVLWILLVNLAHNDSAYKVYLALVLSLYLSFISASAMSFEQFRTIFSRIVVFLAVISLVFFVFTNQLSNYYRYVNIITNLNVASYYNFWVWVMNLDAPFRNFGIFWEPGAFQVFLNLSLLFILQDRRQTPRFRLFASLVLTLAVLSTYSTTGYIGCVLVYSAVLLRNTQLTYRNAIVAIVGFLVLVTATFTLIIGNETVSSKFNAGGMNNGSFVDRYNATLLDAALLNNNIIGGVGAGNYMPERERLERLTGLSASTTPNTYSILGAMFGLFALVFYLAYHVRFSWHISINVVEFLPILLLILILFATENFIYLSLSHLLFWYGILLNRGSESDSECRNERRIS